MKRIWIPLSLLSVPFLVVGGFAWLLLIIIYPFVAPYMMWRYGKVLPFWVYFSWDLVERDWQSLER